MKPKILLAGDFNRSDFLYVAKQLHKEAQFLFIEYLNKKQVKNKECLEYGKVLFWKDFSDAYDLLNKIKPDKVIFYFIEAYNHVALNVACKVKGIPTFHLEHGVRFPVSFYKMVNAGKSNLKKDKSLQDRFLKLFNLRDKYKNRKFFENTVKKSPKEEKGFLNEFYTVRSQNNIFNTFQKLKSPLRLPDTYISFSPKIFDYHREMENLPQAFPVEYIGMPSFDKLFIESQRWHGGSNILFIDQPFAEQDLFGWTNEYRQHFLEKFAFELSRYDKIIYIKPHPWNETKSYDKVSSLNNFFILSEGLEKVVQEISIVIGFNSTLLLPLMAMDHTICFALEMHPAKLEKASSVFLTETGAIKKIDSWAQLSDAFKNLDAIFQDQKRNKGKFTEDWLYKFDGKSTERLKNILLSEAS
jgi:hypothetical protein